MEKVKLGKPVNDSVWSLAWGSVWRSTYYPVYEIRSSVKYNVGTPLEDLVLDEVEDAIRRKIGDGG